MSVLLYGNSVSHIIGAALHENVLYSPEIEVRNLI